MANKPLKTIKFPGLTDTYTVPPVDNAMSDSSTNPVQNKVIKGALDSIESDLEDVSAEVSRKADKDGVVASADQLLSDIYTTNTQPYLYRPTPADSDRERVKRLEGLSVGWNQLAQTPNQSTTVNGITATFDNGVVTLNGTATADATLGVTTSSINLVINHKILCLGGYSDDTTNIRTYLDAYGYIEGANAIPKRGAIFKVTANKQARISFRVGSGSSLTNAQIIPQAIDLTTLFGSTIADHIYTLEQATAGSGVAWVKQYIDLDSYHAYSAPTIKSVEGLEAHVMRDADDNIIGNYPLDSTITLRGIGKLVDGKLVADGDWYEPSGKQTVRYGYTVWDGTESASDITEDSGVYGKRYRIYYSDALQTASRQIVLCNRGVFSLEGNDVGTAFLNGGWIYYYPPTTVTSKSEFITWLQSNNLEFVYPLATPTTSTASPYAEVEICDGNGTEEFVTDSVVPVGNVTEYPTNLKKQVENLVGIPKPSTGTNGTYVLKATVSNGTLTYSWVSAT